MANAEEIKCGDCKFVQGLKQTSKPTNSIWSYITNVGKWSEIIKPQNKPNKENATKVTNIKDESAANILKSDNIEINGITETTAGKSKKIVSYAQEESLMCDPPKRPHKSPKHSRQTRQVSKSSSDEVAVRTNKVTTWVQNVNIQELYQCDKKVLINMNRTELKLPKSGCEDKAKLIGLLLEKIKKLEMQINELHYSTTANQITTSDTSSIKDKEMKDNECSNRTIIALKPPPDQKIIETAVVSSQQSKITDNNTSNRIENNSREVRSEKRKQTSDSTKDYEKNKHLRRHKDRESRIQKHINERKNEEKTESNSKAMKQMKIFNDISKSDDKIKRKTEHSHSPSMKSINKSNSFLAMPDCNEQKKIVLLLNKIKNLEDQLNSLHKPFNNDNSKIDTNKIKNDIGMKEISDNVSLNNCYFSHGRDEKNGSKEGMIVTLKNKKNKTNLKSKTIKSSNKNVDCNFNNIDKECNDFADSDSTINNYYEYNDNISNLRLMYVNKRPPKPIKIKTISRSSSFHKSKSKRNCFKKSKSDTNVLSKSDSLRKKLTVTKINPFQINVKDIHSCVIRHNRNINSLWDTAEYDEIPTKDKMTQNQILVKELEPMFQIPKLDSDSSSESEEQATCENKVQNILENRITEESEKSEHAECNAQAAAKICNKVDNANNQKGPGSSISSCISRESIVNRMLPFQSHQTNYEVEGNDSSAQHSECNYPIAKGYMTAHERKTWEASLKHSNKLKSRFLYNNSFNLINYNTMKVSMETSSNRTEVMAEQPKRNYKNCSTAKQEINENNHGSSSLNCPSESYEIYNYDQTCTFFIPDCDYIKNIRTSTIDLNLFRRLKKSKPLAEQRNESEMRPNVQNMLFKTPAQNEKQNLLSCQQRDESTKSFKNRAKALLTKERNNNERVDEPLKIKKSKSVSGLPGEQRTEITKFELKRRSLTEITDEKIQESARKWLSDFNVSKKQEFFKAVKQENRCRKSKSDWDLIKVMEQGDNVLDSAELRIMQFSESEIPVSNVSSVYLVLVNDPKSNKPQKFNKELLNERQIKKVIADLKNSIDDFIDRKKESRLDNTDYIFLNESNKKVTVNYEVGTTSSQNEVKSTEKLVIKNKEVHKKLKRLKNKDAKLGRNSDKKKRRKNKICIEKKLEIYRTDNKKEQTGNLSSCDSGSQLRLSDVVFKVDKENDNIKNNVLTCIAKVVDNSNFDKKFNDTAKKSDYKRERSNSKSRSKSKDRTRKSEVEIGATSMVQTIDMERTNVIKKNSHTLLRSADAVSISSSDKKNVRSIIDNNTSEDESATCQCLITGANVCFTSGRLIDFQKSEDSGTDNTKKSVPLIHRLDRFCKNRPKSSNETLCHKEILELKKEVCLQRKEVNELKDVWMKCSTRLDDMWKTKEDLKTRMDKCQDTTGFSTMVFDPSPHQQDHCLTHYSANTAVKNDCKVYKPDMIYAFRSLAESSLFLSDVLSDAGTNFNKKDSAIKGKLKPNFLYSKKQKHCVLFQKRFKNKHNGSEDDNKERKKLVSKLRRHSILKEENISNLQSDITSSSSSSSSIDSSTVAVSSSWKTSEKSTQTLASLINDFNEKRGNGRLNQDNSNRSNGTINKNVDYNPCNVASKKSFTKCTTIPREDVNKCLPNIEQSLSPDPNKQLPML